MEDRTIPLKRPRAGVAQPIAVRPQHWLATVSSGARAALDPPHRLWLAALGGAALAARGVQRAWARLVTEGEAVEARLLARPAPFRVSG